MSDATFDAMWSAIAGIGRDPSSGGYRRFAWTDPDLELREWFAGESAERGLDLVEDRMGNQWAWWGDPDHSPGSSPARIWTACPTAVRSTARWAWSVRSQRSMPCAPGHSSPSDRSASSTSSTRKGPDSAWPAPAPG